MFLFDAPTPLLIYESFSDFPLLYNCRICLTNGETDSISVEKTNNLLGIDTQNPAHTTCLRLRP